MRHALLMCLQILLVMSCAWNSFALAQDEAESGPQYRLIGPYVSGRAGRVTGVAGDPLTYYLATAAGGVWKSSNGGQEWEAIFDETGVSSIGSVAVAPSAPYVVYVGTGEANIRGNVGKGQGIYKSSDGGKHWQQVWRSQGQIGTLQVHPQNPDVVYAAVLGNPFAANDDRGVYRSRDGGQNWQRVLFVDADTGAADVAMDPNNPNILFAGMWQARRQPWHMQSGGPGSALFRSNDGGDHWEKLSGDGLPDGLWGRVGVRVAASNSQRVYALIEAEEGGLFRSDDGGDNWIRVNDSHGIRQRAWYYTTLTIDPLDADTVWMPNVNMQKTIDGGEHLHSVKGGGWDYHDVWIDPSNPKRMAVASDAGVSLSWDGGSSWIRPPLPISQFYRISVDQQEPYQIMGSVQDLGTQAGPSNSLHGGGIFLSDWHTVGGGEAGYVVARPDDPKLIYAGEYLGFLSRYDDRIGQSSHVGIYPDNGSGHGAVDLRHRFQWTAPIHISPHDPNLVYHASQTLQRSRDGGQSWEVISPDLSRNDASKQAWSGGPITGDNTGVEFYSTIFAVAESPVEKGVIWVGSDDGLVHITRDDGVSWQQITPAGFPQWGTVAMIEVSTHHPGTAYVVADAHRLNDDHPYLWKTENYGKSWKKLTTGLDESVYLHVVREDRQVPGLLYLGSDRGMLWSQDDGQHWQSMQLNLPPVAVIDLALSPNDLVVATLGRSLWVLDDLTPYRQAEQSQQSVQFYPPLPTRAWFYGPEPSNYGPGSGENPPEGVILNYQLPAVPEKTLVLNIYRADGQLVRQLSSEAEAVYPPEGHPDYDPGSTAEAELTTVQGLNRAVWDLNYQPAERISDSTNDAGDVHIGPRALPGEYRLELVVDGQAYTQTLNLLPDPRATASTEDLIAQLRYSLELRDRISELSRLVEMVRVLKSDLNRLSERLSGDPEKQSWVAQAKQLNEQLYQVELVLYSPNAEVNYDILAGRDGGAKLYSRYGWLYLSSLNHQGMPTQGMREVAAELNQLFESQQNLLRQEIVPALERLNQSAGDSGPILVPHL